MAKRLYPVGVYKEGNKTGFKAKVYHEGKVIYIGSYETPELAAAAYKKAKESLKPSSKILSSQKPQPLSELKGTPFYGL